MPQVHPTAMVGRNVELADDASVGPYCVLEGRVKVGSGTTLLHHVTLQGPITIGKKNIFYPNACVGFAPQDRKFDHQADGAGTVIGDDNIFREGATVHRATKDRPTTVGSRNYMMVNTHVAHDCVVGSDCMFANGALLGGHVEVGDRAILGGNAAVHQFCRIGRLAMMSGVTAASQDVPPFCVVYVMKTIGSLNVVGLRRAGLGAHMKPLNHAFDLVFRSRLNMHTAMERIVQECGGDALCLELVEFIKTSKRGITAYGGKRGDVETAEAPGVTI